MTAGMLSVHMHVAEGSNPESVPFLLRALADMIQTDGWPAPDREVGGTPFAVVLERYSPLGGADVRATWWPKEQDDAATGRNSLRLADGRSEGPAGSPGEPGAAERGEAEDARADFAAARRRARLMPGEVWERRIRIDGSTEGRQAGRGYVFGRDERQVPVLVPIDDLERDWTHVSSTRVEDERHGR